MSKRLNEADKAREIASIISLSKSCDWGLTRSTTFYGGGIRVMTSRGLHKAYGNHNFPIWKDPISGTLMTLQIETPVARVVTLAEYVTELYEDGGRVIICRPDVFVDKNPAVEQEKHLRSSWLAMEGTAYDKKSILQIAKMYMRIRRKVPENGKETVYCTEGTFAPFIDDFEIWTPDILKGERYPVPIHSEHIMRSKRCAFVAGNQQAYNDILHKY